MHKVGTCLWFDDQALEAAEFYTSVIKNSRITEVVPVIVQAPSGPPPGGVAYVVFELEGQEYLALNGGPLFPLTPAVSIVVNCADQAEVDDVWGKLAADGGQEVQCGWLTDKFGLSWQIVPEELYELVNSSGDVEAAKRATEEMLGQVKLDIEALRRAYNGE